MRVARLLVWIAALLPVSAAGLWASFAGRWPEPCQERLALGEVTPRWTWTEWSDFVGEPTHFVTRVLHLGALQVPGATIASVTWINALLAVAIAVALAGLLRRCFPLQGCAAPAALAITGLLAASPAYGADWLHAERLGLFLPPLLLLWVLAWLHGDHRSTLRALGALCLVALAPFCHTHGVLLTFALLPALAAHARRRGARIPAWIGACLVVGNVAAVFSLRSAGQLTAEHSAFGATVLAWLERTGRAWMDLMPSSTYDEWLLGGLSWLLPAFVWWTGDRSVEARSRAAPWWSCFCFGLLIVVCDGLRYDVEPPAGTWREAMYGAFLLPVGAIGVLAARFGNAVVLFAGGALAVLAVQEWPRGVEDLRRARMRVLEVEARMALPTALQPDAAPVAVPLRIAADVERLRHRGQVPPPDDAISAAIAVATAGESSRFGTATAGDVHHVEGTVRSSLRYDTVQALIVVAGVAGQDPRIVGTGDVEFARGRNAAWKVSFRERLLEGDRVRVLGYLPRLRQLTALGPPFVVHGGALLPEAERP
ncbi:MAG TPA: hypothetical protein VF384_19285 [Planctomycetota bacterium]